MCVYVYICELCALLHCCAVGCICCCVSMNVYAVQRATVCMLLRVCCCVYVNAYVCVYMLCCVYVNVCATLLHAACTISVYKDTGSSNHLPIH